LTEFEFSPNLKDEVGAGNEDIDTHPKLVPFILILNFIILSPLKIEMSLKIPGLYEFGKGKIRSRPVPPHCDA
jgi:hypothetical protein